MTPNTNVIFFDGVCNLCNASVLFVLKRDKHLRFNFASMQSNYAKEKLSEFNLDSSMESVLLLNGKTILNKSSAALEISRYLTGLWPMLYLFIIIPKFIRDFVYDLIAANRYKIFGKRDRCMIPTPEIQSRFYN